MLLLRRHKKELESLLYTAISNKIHINKIYELLFEIKMNDYD